MSRLSGAAWSFVGATLKESTEIWRAVGVSCIDLLLCPEAVLSPEEIVASPSHAANRIRALDTFVPNAILIFGTTFQDRAINHPDPAIRRCNTNDFVRIVEFCRLSGVRSITVLPGVTHADGSQERSLEIAGQSLTELTAIAAASGVAVSFEAHLQSILENPSDVRAFLSANPALKLTLDYSHFICGGYSPEAVHDLVTFAQHVHLRQAAPGALQARWSSGIIDFCDVVQRLEGSGYTGFYCIEYEHDPWMGSDNVDVLCESLKMRNLVGPLIRGNGV